MSIYNPASVLKLLISYCLLLFSSVSCLLFCLFSTFCFFSVQIKLFIKYFKMHYSSNLLLLGSALIRNLLALIQKAFFYCSIAMKTVLQIKGSFILLKFLFSSRVNLFTNLFVTWGTLKTVHIKYPLLCKWRDSAAQFVCENSISCFLKLFFFLHILNPSESLYCQPICNGSLKNFHTWMFLDIK